MKVFGRLKGVINLFVTLIAFVFIISFTFSSCKKKEEKVIKIGAILPLTGSAAEFGVDEQRGMELAIKNLNLKNKLEIIYEDSKNSAKEALNAYRKIKERINVPILLTAMSTVGLALKPLIIQDKVVMFVVGGNPSLTANSAGFVIRTLPSAQNQGKELAVHAGKLNIKTVGVYYSNDDLGKGVAESFKKEFEKKEGIIKIFESFEPKEGIDISVLYKIKQSSPDAVLVVGHGTLLGQIIKKLREIRYNGLILGTPELPYPSVLKIAGKAAENAIVVDVIIDTSSFMVKNFRKDYLKQWGKEPSLDSYLGYMEIEFINYLIQQLGQNKIKDEKAIRNVLIGKTIKTILGEVTILENGDVYFPLGLKIIKNGKAVPYR